MPYNQINTVSWRFKPVRAYLQVANDARYRYVSPLERHEMLKEDLMLLLANCDENSPILLEDTLDELLYAHA
ncbi:MAG: hypothetical protein K6F05_07185 [Succinivibrio sp.]|nr:hypothetical protein [Succinivibrio sp.]